jgi:hypothetical protein
MPSRHFRFGSKTPDPEFPVVATSRISVENFVRDVKGSTRGETIWDSVACVASTTMTGSPGHGGASHSSIRGSLTLESSFSSTNNKLKSTSSAEPCFRTFAGNTGNTIPAMRTPILASTEVRCAAVMINPEFRYTPEPVWCPFPIIAAVAIQGPPLSFRSAPLDMIGAKSPPARQRANAKRTLSSPRRKRDPLGHLNAPRAQGQHGGWRGIRC